jgi:hypothetical protein
MKTTVKAGARAAGAATGAPGDSGAKKPVAMSALPRSSDLGAMIAKELPALRLFRHDLHKHPELSFQEKRTSQVVQRELAALGIRFKSGLGGGTGVVG